MKRNLNSKIYTMVNEEFHSQLNEMKFNGKEYTWDDIKRAGIAVGLSASLLAYLGNELQKEAQENADMASWEQSDEGIRDRQTTYDMINGTYDGLDECIKKTIKKTLKKLY